ncbi:uncharacterized protein [Branchiostoma lanceolatum]|uniref:uncharacterized protein n=1 Tax=Branchiostoma lanceolatum TaxID=7740 RepID=UPI0034544E1E
MAIAIKRPRSFLARLGLGRLLLNNCVTLIDKLQVKKVIPDLIQEGILSIENREEIMAHRTSQDRAQALLDKVIGRGACILFVDILRRSGQGNLADMLEGKPDSKVAITEGHRVMTDSQLDGDGAEVTRSSKKRPRASPPPDVVPKKKKQKGPKCRQGDHGAGPRGARKEPGAKDVSKYFLYIKDNVADGWKDLAQKLGFSWADVKTIDDRNKDYKSRCQDVLGEWQSRNGNDATIGVLMNALEEVKLKKVVDGLKDKYPELR